MAYVGFDLDETLGRFSVASYAGLFLQPKTAIYESIWSSRYGSDYVAQPIPFSERLKAKCEAAFELFVDCLVEKERAEPALGLIRPSMVDFIHRLYELKQVGAVKSVLIYSNNGNPALLKLAAKILEKLAGAPGLFCNFIHWYHPSRIDEIWYGKPGSATKSLKVLVKAFHNTSCSSSDEDIHQKDIYFFDDSIPPHKDLLRSLGYRYFQVEPYRFDADPNVILECFKKACEGAGLIDDQEYLKYIGPIIGYSNNFASLIKTMEKDFAKLKLKKIIPNDTNLRLEFNSIFPRRVSKANFTRSLTSMRKLENKLNQGMLLSNQEKANYKKAKNLITNYERENPNQMGGKKKFRKTMRRRRHT
jgi:hypothetical protein